MKTSYRITLSVVVFSLLVSLGHTADAKFTFIISQSGPNISIVGAGTINTTALSYNSIGITSPSLYPRLAVLDAGATESTSFALYKGAVGPSSFGTGSMTLYPLGIGDLVGTDVGNSIDLPAGYISNSPLSNNDIIPNQTIASAGLTPGIYVDTWGSGPTADSLTINIGVVPEPASIALAGATASAALLRRRRRLV